MYTKNIYTKYPNSMKKPSWHKAKKDYCALEQKVIANFTLNFDSIENESSIKMNEIDTILKKQIFKN